jgi:putative transposase
MKTKGYTPTFRDLKGMPSFKSKKNNDYSFTTNNQKGTIKLYSDVATGYTYIVIPKLKTPIRILLHRGLIEGATLKSVTISKDILGNFNISLLQEYETTPRKQTITEDNSIGLDYAQQDFYVDSEGQTANYPRYAKQMEVKLAKEQKKLSRMVLRSNNWFKQKKKVSQIQSKIARQRLDWSHKESTKIANSYAMVSLEDLDLRNLAQCLSLGKNLHDNGFGTFRTALEYKLQERGGLLIKIDKWFPSSKVCSECGVIHENLQLSDRTYVCDSCGLTISRDHNAAINIKREGLRIALS